MRFWLSRAVARHVVAVLFLTFGSAALPTAIAQVRIASSPDSVARVDEVLRQGQTLERERRWGEALAHYEEALRQFPGETQLEHRFARTKIHYDLARRYNDASFRQALDTMAEADALSLYAEVLLKIQSHYVDQPGWRALVDRGTSCLEIALEDPVFIERHLARVQPEAIERTRRELRSRFAAWPMTDRHQARQAVERIAQTCNRELGLPSNAVVFEYTCGATTALDDYSSFLTADQLDEVYSQIDGNFVGLGIELKAAENSLTIVKVIPNSPAQRSGLLAGDRIVAVSGRSTADLTTEEAANLLQGPEGSVVEVTAQTPGQAPRRIGVHREHVEIPSVVDDAIIDPAMGVAYLKLNCFQKTTVRDLDAALWRLHRAGMKSLIIDLQGNPGGLLTSAVEVVDKFVSEGTIVSTRGRNPHEDFTYAAHRAGTWRVPLVVLIDGDSASASEIFAGAIRDHRRGTIVGTKSYGKGSVQGIFPLNFARSGLRLTTAKFYSPNGHPFSKVGVEPDVLIHKAAKPILAAGGAVEVSQPDPVLTEALRIARQHVARRDASASGTAAAR